MTPDQVIAKLKALANAQTVQDMARFGINPTQALGISLPSLRKMAKEIGRHLQAKALKEAMSDPASAEASSGF
jgi:3-methyladenine DNA glycosylase AlkD